MSNRQAENVLKGINFQLQKRLGHLTFELTSKEFVGNGNTESIYDHVGNVSIGIKELRFSENREISNADYRNMPVDDYQFMCALVSEFHELSHVGQVKELIHKAHPSASYVMIGYMAHGASEDYYKKNYDKMPQEISAQYSGIRNAHKLLTEKLGSEKADALICDYVKRHINNEFIELPKEGKFTNVEDIFDAYNKVFVESKTAKRIFNEKAIDNVIAEVKDKRKKPPDYLIRYLTVYKNGRGELQDVIDNKTGIEQDMFVAKAFVLATDPGHKIRKQFKSLKSIDFGTVGIDKVDKIVNRTIDRIRGQYKTSKSITSLNIDDTVAKLSKDVDVSQLDLY